MLWLPARPRSLVDLADRNTVVRKKIKVWKVFEADQAALEEFGGAAW